MTTNIVKHTNLSPVLTAMQSHEVVERFQQAMGDDARTFMTSVISALSLNPALQTCEPQSVINAALIAASVKLPVNQNFGYAHIVPYSGKAQFQMGWRGYVQLALRSGQYRSIPEPIEIFEGEAEYDRFAGELKILGKRTAAVVVGYYASFELLNGFRACKFMTAEEMEDHATTYSASYKNDKKYTSKKSIWTTNFKAMAKKTVIKLLLSQFGLLSIEMQKALTADQSVIDDNGMASYTDNGGGFAPIPGEVAYEVDSKLDVFKAAVDALPGIDGLAELMAARLPGMNGDKIPAFDYAVSKGKALGYVFDRSTKSFVKQDADKVPPAQSDRVADICARHHFDHEAHLKNWLLKTTGLVELPSAAADGEWKELDAICAKHITAKDYELVSAIFKGTFGGDEAPRVDLENKHFGNLRAVVQDMVDYLNSPACQIDTADLKPLLPIVAKYVLKVGAL